MAAHEPINYLDSILNEEDKRICEFDQKWRTFSVSRSGRFKSKNKKRDVIDGSLFDNNNWTTTAEMESNFLKNRYTDGKETQTTHQLTSEAKAKFATTVATNRSEKDYGKKKTFQGFYETNL